MVKEVLPSGGGNIGVMKRLHAATTLICWYIMIWSWQVNTMNAFLTPTVHRSHMKSGVQILSVNTFKPRRFHLSIPLRKPFSVQPSSAIANDRFAQIRRQAEIQEGSDTALSDITFQEERRSDYDPITSFTETMTPEAVTHSIYHSFYWIESLQKELNAARRWENGAGRERSLLDARDMSGHSNHRPSMEIEGEMDLLIQRVLATLSGERALRPNGRLRRADILAVWEGSYRCNLCHRQFISDEEILQSLELSLGPSGMSSEIDGKRDCSGIRLVDIEGPMDDEQRIEIEGVEEESLLTFDELTKFIYGLRGKTDVDPKPNTGDRGRYGGGRDKEKDKETDTMRVSANVEFIHRLAKALERHMNVLSKPVRASNVIPLESVTRSEGANTTIDRVRWPRGGILKVDQLGRMFFGLRNFNFEHDATQRLLRSIGYIARLVGQQQDPSLPYQDLAMGKFSIAMPSHVMGNCFQGLRNVPCHHKVKSWHLSWLMRSIPRLLTPFNAISLSAVLSSVRTLAAPHTNPPNHVLYGRTLVLVGETLQHMANWVINDMRERASECESDGHPIPRSLPLLGDMSVSQFGECFSSLKLVSNPTVALSLPSTAKPIAISILAIIEQSMRYSLSTSSSTLTRCRNAFDVMKILNPLSAFSQEDLDSYNSTDILSLDRYSGDSDPLSTMSMTHVTIPSPSLSIRLIDTLYRMLLSQSSYEGGHWMTITSSDQLYSLAFAIQGFCNLTLSNTLLHSHLLDILALITQAIENTPKEYKIWGQAAYAAAVSGLRNMDFSNPVVSRLLDAISTITISGSKEGCAGPSVSSLLRTVRSMGNQRKEALSILLTLDKWLKGSKVSMDIFQASDIMFELQNVPNLRNPTISQLFDIVIRKLSDQRYIQQVMNNVDASHISSFLLGVKSMSIDEGKSEGIGGIENSNSSITSKSDSKRIRDYLHYVIDLAKQCRKIDINLILQSDTVKILPMPHQLYIEKLIKAPLIVRASGKGSKFSQNSNMNRESVVDSIDNMKVNEAPKLPTHDAPNLTHAPYPFPPLPPPPGVVYGYPPGYYPWGATGPASPAYSSHPQDDR